MYKYCGILSHNQHAMKGCGIIFANLSKSDEFANGDRFKVIDYLAFCKDCYERRTSRNVAEIFGGINEKRLMLNVLIQAVKDYNSLHKNYVHFSTLGYVDEAQEYQVEKNLIREWVNNSNGTFTVVAQAWGKDHIQAQEFVIAKFNAIDNGELLKNFEFIGK